MKKLAIISTHPIQYYAPLFMLLAQQKGLLIKVFYTWGKDSITKYDPAFQREIEWDIPLLHGYEYEFLINTSSTPGSHHFSGIRNPEAIARINNFNPDVLLIFGWSYHSHLNIIRHFSGRLPVWFRGDSTLLDEKRTIKNLIKFIFLKWVYSHINKALYAGTNNKHYFEKYGSSELKLSFVPHSIDNARFSADKLQEALSLRSKLNIAATDILVLFAGKFEEKKSPLLLLQAFSEVAAPNMHLLLVGNGPLENQLKEAASGQENIHFLEFQNQQRMPVIYQSCDLFCLPSSGSGETWGLAVNEAMASGKAILASDKVGCAIDLVSKGINGDIFKAGDKEDLKIKILNLCSPNTLKSMGIASRGIIDDWSVENSVSNLIKELL